jgi:hypothetical protein
MLTRAPVQSAIDYAKFRSRSHDAVIRVYDEAGSVIQTHEHQGAISKSREFYLASCRASR